MLKIITKTSNNGIPYLDGSIGYVAFVEGLEEIQGMGTGRIDAIGDLMRRLANKTNLVGIDNQ